MKNNSWNVYHLGRILLILGMFVAQFGPLGLLSPVSAASPKAINQSNMNSTSTATLAATGTSPVLVIYNDNFTGNVFSRYLGEIMKAEGFTLFDTAQLSGVTAAGLAAYDTVVLAQTSLTSAQATMFSSYVQNGGSLIAMRPDGQLASMMGLGTPSGTLNNGYMAIQTTTSYGQGFVPDSVQLHTTGDQYAGVTAQKVALLYSNAGTPTVYPAVTVNNYGNGRAAAFTYDLASAVVNIRQGNSALADLDADSDGITRTVDLYYNWIDLNKMALPQADIHQRLFGRLLSSFNSFKKPLPRFWYFPNAKNTAIVFTSDAHGNPDSSFNNLIASMRQYNVTTSFYQRYGPTQDVLNTWLAQGFTYNIHPYRQGNPSLTDGYIEASTWYQQNYGPPATHTVRVHRLENQGWVDGLKIAGSFGFNMDYSFYRYGAWLQRPDSSWARGYMMGSSLPMKGIDQNGQIVNVFAQYTEIADDQMNYPGPENLSNDNSYFYTKQAIDVSRNGYYQPVIIQAHVDYYASEQSWFESTMAYGRSLSLPFLNGDEWSAFTINRYNSTFTNLSWASNQLTFTAAIPTGQNGQTVMLPAHNGTSNIQSLKVNGTTTTFSTGTINGEDFAFVILPGGTYTLNVTYTPDTTPPVVSNITAVPAGSSAQINWTTNELASSLVNYGSTSALGSNATASGSTVNHSVTLNGLTVGTTYYYQVVSTDLSNNTTTSATNTFVATNAAPTISQVTPPTVVNNVATTLTITGTNFVATPTVLLGSQALSGVILTGSTKLTAIVPAGFATGIYNLTVTNPDNGSGTLANSVTVQLPAPTLASVSPTSGANNNSTTITLNGANFVSGATVKLGSTNLGSVSFVSASQLTAIVPSGLAQGLFDLTVTNPDGQSVTLPAAYTVGPPVSGPTLSQVTPAVVKNTVSNVITLSGSNFVAPVNVALTGSNQAGVTLVNANTVTFTLAANFTPGNYDVKISNGNGQSSTLSGGLVVLPQSIIQTTQADFNTGNFKTGVITTTQANSRLDGEVKLKPALEDYFAGTSLDSTSWVSGPWPSGSGTVTVNNGSLALTGNVNARTINTFVPSRLQFKAKFASGTSNQHIGFADDNFAYSWVIFSVPGWDTSRLYARSNVNGISTDIPLSVTLDTFHDFVITASPNQIQFFVDNVLVSTHNVNANNPYTVWFSNGSSSGSLVVDSVVAGTYPTSGNYTSTSLDAGQSANWTKLNWQNSVAPNTSVSVQARTSTDKINWSAWSTAATTAGDVPLSLPPGRYLQYILNFATSDTSQSPEVFSVAGVYSNATPGPLARIAVTPANQTLPLGATQQFTAQGFDSNNLAISGLTFTWSTTGGGTINSASGLYTAGGTVGSYPNSVNATSGTITGSASVSVTLNAPSISNVSPVSGPANVATTITINGSNFVSGATVKLDTNSLGSVSFVSANQLTAVVPAGLPQGVYSLVVTNPDTQSATVPSAYTVNPPVPGPTLSQVTPAVVANTAANIVTLTGSNFVGPVSVALSGANQPGATLVNQNTVTFTLATNFPPGTYDVKVINSNGESSNLPGGLVVLPQAIIQTTPADFTGGSAIFTTTAATSRLDGEIKLKTELEDYFAGTSLDPAAWASGPQTTGGTVVVNNGSLSVTGAYARSVVSTPPTRLQFKAKFASGTPYQHIGFADQNFAYSWVIFSVPDWDTSHLYARSNVNGGWKDTQLAVSLDTFHDFMITVVGGAVQFYVDGTLVEVQNFNPNNPYNVWISNASTAGALVVDGIQSGNYAAAGSYLSAPLDAGQSATWNKLNWQVASSASGSVSVQARTSTDKINWSAWSTAATTAGDVPLSLPPGRFLQYNLNLATTDLSQSPEVLSVAGVIGNSGPGPLARIAVTPTTASLVTGTTQQFTAQGFDSNNVALTNLTFSWSTAAGGTINSTSGLYTAGGTGGTFPASVIATSGTITGSADVVITLPAPAITTVSPASGSTGVANTLTITGTNFVNGATVKLGTTNLSNVTFVSSTGLTAVVPAGFTPGVYTLTVTNPDTQQATLANAYSSIALPAPTITSVAPASGVNNGANTITITGTNFVATPVVGLGATSLGSVTFVSSTRLTAVVPPGFTAGVYTLSVTNPDTQQTSLANAYTSVAGPAPAVTSVAPAVGANTIANTITITGSNFVAPPVVLLGTSSLGSVTVVSSTRLTAVVPAGFATGVYTLTVTNPDNQQGSLANAYTSAVPPTFTSLSPTSRDNLITRTLTITGTNFVATPVVRVGTTALTNVTFVSATRLTALVPAGFPTGTYTVSVTNPSGLSASLANAYTVTAPPTITQNSVSAFNGTFNNTSLTLSGSSTVEINMTPTFQDGFTTNSLDTSKWTNNNLVFNGSVVQTGGNGGEATLRGTYIRSNTNYVQGVVEGRINFPTPVSGASQSFGWGTGSLTGGPWAMFGVPNTTTNGVYARTNINGTITDTRIASVNFNTYYKFRIVVGTSNVTFYVNDALVATHNVTTSTAMNVMLYNSTRNNSFLADWVRVNRFPSTATYTSGTIDSGSSTTTWTDLAWTGTVPAGTNLTIQTQTSPNGTSWTTLSPAITANSAAIASPPGRYLRYVLTFTPSTDLTVSAALSSITLTYTPQT